MKTDHACWRQEGTGAGMTQKETMQQKRGARMAAELARVQQMRDYETEAVRSAGGQGLICGIEEAGRGPLAGPVAAAAVILPEDLLLPYLNDSKKVTEKRREVLFAQIKEKALAWAVVMVPPDRIDEINILQATYEAMRTAVGQLAVRPDVLVNDAVTIPGMDILQVPVIKGDAKCISIAAASILAKVTRDTYMKEMDRKYPAYGFAGHKGYGTKAHCQAILEYGPCPIHRRSFLGRILAGQHRGQGVSAVQRESEDTASGSCSPENAGSMHDGEEKNLLKKNAPSSRQETGRRGEEEAVRFLSKKGVKILERNFRDRNGEIDLIGEQDGVLLFIEVKYRGSQRFGTPEEAVTPEKQHNICRTALYYLHQTGRAAGTSVRFDVIALTDASIRWIRDAFPFTD